MTKEQVIELLEDQFEVLTANKVREYFHPKMIEHLFDKQYRFYLDQAFKMEPESIFQATQYYTGVEVYYDIDRERYFSVVPKDVISMLSMQGGVWGVTRAGVKFEPFSSYGEIRNWSRLTANFGDIVRWWSEKGIDRDEMSVSSVTDSSFEEYETVVWYEDGGGNLSTGNKVDMQLLITFPAHGDKEEVYVPKSVGGITSVIDSTIRIMLNKLNINAEIYKTNEDKE
jgi:hypothetical protein